MIDMAEAMADTTVKRHPIMAVVWGIVGGVGVSLFLMGRAVIAFGRWTAPIIIIVIMIALNLLWAYFGPAKKPKGPPPVAMEAEPVTMAEAGFDAAADAGAEAAESGLAPPPGFGDPPGPPGYGQPGPPGTDEPIA